MKDLVVGRMKSGKLPSRAIDFPSRHPGFFAAIYQLHADRVLAFCHVLTVLRDGLIGGALNLSADRGVLDSLSQLANS